MPGSGPAPRRDGHGRNGHGRALAYLQGAVLRALMAMAAVILERRIRKALRSGGEAGAGPQGGQEG